MKNLRKIPDQTTVRFFYSLIRSAVLEQPLSQKLTVPDMQTVFYYANLNSISGLLYYGIFLNELPLDRELRNSWKRQLFETVYYNLLLQENWIDLKKELDRLDIQYIPVKGSVIQNCYPKIGMRSMSDYDILYRYQQENERGLKSKSLRKLRSLHGKNGICITSGGIVDSLTMGNTCLFEMHREFLGSDQPAFNYYHRIWNLCETTENENEFRLSDSEQFILMLVHSHKHYSSAGCGPKELIDYYVVRHCSDWQLDWEYIHKVLTELDLGAYEKMLDRLTKIIFEDEPGTEKDWVELERWLKAGTYGNEEREVSTQIAQYTSQGYSLYKAKLIYLFKRLYPTADFIKDQFPFFYRHKILIPFLPVYRTVRSPQGVFCKIKNEIKILAKKETK